MAMDITSAEFAAAVAAAGDEARRDALAHGIAVFYYDDETGIDVMEQPDGRRFEIRYIPGAPGDRNYQVIRELTASAA
jgi:hypothetical protein